MVILSTSTWAIRQNNKLEFYNHKLIFHKSIEKCEHEQDIEQSDSFNPVELENQMIMANLTKSLSSKGIQIIETIDFNKSIFLLQKEE